MNTEIKVGDLVETCSLMPGVVMKREGDDLQVRELQYDDYSDNHFSDCSLRHCGIKKLTAQQVLDRLIIGKNRLEKLYDKYCNNNTSWEEYDKTVADEAKLTIN